MFFVNDIGNRILAKVFNSKKFMKNDALINESRASDLKVFYVFKNI